MSGRVAVRQFNMPSQAMQKHPPGRLSTQSPVDSYQERNTAATPTSPQRVSAVHESMADLARAIEELHSKQMSLFERLQPVMRREPANAEQKPKDPGHSVPMVEFVRGQTDKICDMIRHIDAVNNLVEL